MSYRVSRLLREIKAKPRQAVTEMSLTGPTITYNVALDKSLDYASIARQIAKRRQFTPYAD